MGINVKFDLIRFADMRNTIQGFELVRGVMVREIPIVVNALYGADPGVLIKALGAPNFPQLYSSLPVPGFDWLTVKEQRLREVVRKDCLKFDVIYRGTDPSGQSSATWTVRDGYTISYVPTFATSDGSNALKVYYKKDDESPPINSAGLPASPPGPPKGAQVKAVKVHKPVSHRVVTATQIMSKTAWDAAKGNMRSLAGKINSDNWNGTRGQWYFVGPETTTTDIGITVLVKAQFLFEEKGWYPEAAWFTNLGEHPTDCITEGDLRDLGLPAEDDVKMANGLTICSVTGEGAFNTAFAGVVL